jgi:hypothetical protein
MSRARGRAGSSTSSVPTWITSQTSPQPRRALGPEDRSSTTPRSTWRPEHHISSSPRWVVAGLRLVRDVPRAGCFSPQRQPSWASWDVISSASRVGNVSCGCSRRSARIRRRQGAVRRRGMRREGCSPAPGLRSRSSSRRDGGCRRCMMAPRFRVRASPSPGPRRLPWVVVTQLAPEHLPIAVSGLTHRRPTSG